MIDDNSRTGDANRRYSHPSPLNYVDSVVYTVGHFSELLSKYELYEVFCKVIDWLVNDGIVDFKPSSQELFFKMLDKLYRKDYITYIKSDDLQYHVMLTDKGEARYDLIVNRLYQQNLGDRLEKIYRFYREPLTS